jgi:hypothetical protein
MRVNALWVDEMAFRGACVQLVGRRGQAASVWSTAIERQRGNQVKNNRFTQSSRFICSGCLQFLLQGFTKRDEKALGIAGLRRCIGCHRRGGHSHVNLSPCSQAMTCAVAPTHEPSTSQILRRWLVVLLCTLQEVSRKLFRI